ncbi:unnamed protein product [Musa acuminata subsp. malaccensis]|uniref:(wild Malaysian banana) hypothetical protein n=1 Tax=Musa acuminata subsp. malaccensis TaxID=214687 RepID=A0A804J2L1_MUSAM|nr:unnamed protein product [Musa acuminata subsp. malaccensis]
MSPLSPRKMHHSLPLFFLFFLVCTTEKKIPFSLPNPLAQSRLFITRSTELNSLLSIAGQSSSRTQKLASVSLHAEWKNQKDSVQNQSNGKKFIKSLLSRRK